jgi:hypothetical protein
MFDAIAVLIIVIPKTAFYKNTHSFSEVLADKLRRASPGNYTEKIRLSFFPCLLVRPFHRKSEPAYRDVAACGVSEFRVRC